MALLRTTRSCTYGLANYQWRSLTRQVHLHIGITQRCLYPSQPLSSKILNSCNFRFFGATSVQKSVCDTLHKVEEDEESPELRECFRLLDLTSESFTTLIKQLQHESRVPVCLLFLFLRGLDTIEDDMTIPIKKKVPLLRDFYKVIGDESWTYNSNSPEQKDRELLVKFDIISKEFNKIKEEYQNSIKDQARKMGKGMAEFTQNAQNNPQRIQTVRDYEYYCEFTGGTEGMAKLTGFVSPSQLELVKPLAQLGGQADHILDFRLDYEDKRYLWPKEVWSRYVNQLPDLILPENEEKALQCQSEMILIALRHAVPCLTFFAEINEPSTFQFFAGPQTMCISILEFCFQNYGIFQDKHIRKDLRVGPFENFQIVCKTFRECAQKIKHKNMKRPHDPHFLDISVACNKIEKYTQGIFQTKKTR